MLRARPVPHPSLFHSITDPAAGAAASRYPGEGTATSATSVSAVTPGSGPDARETAKRFGTATLRFCDPGVDPKSGHDDAPRQSFTCAGDTRPATQGSADPPLPETPTPLTGVG
eukprot:14398341-Alexandrium_andersonii.AAC.1